MKFFSYLIITVTVLFFFVACTGSKEDGSESNVLFVVAFQDKVGLVDGETLTSKDLTVQQDSLFTSKQLSESSKAVAFDFSNRNSRRDELFILSRDDSNQAYVSVFDMTKANIANGDGALVSKRDVIKVDVGLARAENVAAPSSFCVTDIQVDQTGQYITLLSNQRACDSGSQESNTIDIIDIGSGLNDVPEIVFHKNLSMTIGENSQIFTDQNAERLFFFEDSAKQGSLRKLSIPEFKEETVLRNLNITDVIDIQPFTRLNNGDEELIITRTENYSVVTNYLDTATLENAVSYGETIKQLFFNPIKESFFALTDSEFVIFDTPALANKTSRSLNAKDAIYVPTPNDFVYMLSERNISRYDSLKDFIDVTPSVDSFNVSGLEDVQLFSWVREAATIAVP